MERNVIALQIALLAFYSGLIITGHLGPHEFLLSSGIMVMSAIVMYSALKHFRRINFEVKMMFAVIVLWAGLDIYRFMTVSGIIEPLLPSGVEPNIYLAVNVLLAIICTHYFIKNIKEWHKYQLILDTIFVLTLILVFISGFYMETDLVVDTTIFNMGSIFFFIFPNGIILSLLTILIISTRNRKMNPLLRIYVMAMLAYVAVDLIYVYMLIRDISHLSVLNVFYNIIFASIAIGTRYLREENRAERIPVIPNFDYSNIGKSRASFVVVAGSLFLIYLKVISFRTFFHVVVIALIYLFLTSYLKNLIFAQRLLANERQLTSDLEERVIQRTEMLVQANRQLQEQSERDMLTGIYNRHYFFDKLKSLTEAEEAFTLMYLDLDRFKFINDVHGHAIGDQVIKVISDRFKENCSNKCMISRIGGDEFAVIIKSKSPEVINSYAKNITDLVEEEILIEGYRFKISISIGVARYPDDATAPKSLLKYADTAMYYSKRNKNQEGFFYDDDSIKRIERRHRIEWLLYRADFDKEFEVHYQPQFKAMTKELIGMEALLRWNSPELGSVGPYEFIPIAEEAGHIEAITDWVMDRAIQQVKAWNLKYKKDLIVGINISATSLNSVDFEDKIYDVIRRNEIEAHWVDLEMTEYNSINIFENTPKLLEQLRAMGISISIDDFGTGYSSLSYIKKLKVNRIKIAKEMIDTIVDQEEDRLIIKAIIEMAHSLSYKVIAEGVETAFQLNILKEIGCDEIQGYLWGRPMAGKVFEDLFLT